MTQIPFPLNDEALAAFVTAALAEDLGSGDITSNSVIPADTRLDAIMAAREPMVVSGLPVARAIFQVLDPDVTFSQTVADGTFIEEGAGILEVRGMARALLSAERTALNIVQHLSGIATMTHQYVEAVKGTGARILDTRKTIPLLRALNKYAAACGGAKNHRMGLYDAVMIKDNHIAVAGSIAHAVAAARKAGLPEAQATRIQVECDTISQVREALEAGADSLLLDNMPPHMLRQALRVIDGRVPTEASGGVRMETVRAIAETGIDYISIGRLTQSAPAVDIGLDFKAVS